MNIEDISLWNVIIWFMLQAFLVERFRQKVCVDYLTIKLGDFLTIHARKRQIVYVTTFCPTLAAQSRRLF